MLSGETSNSERGSIMILKNGREKVRILLVGDTGSGKTSLILSLINEDFLVDAPRKAEEIIIPADVTPEQIPTNIVDYNAIEQNDDTLSHEINEADVICVVYSVEDESALDRITQRWLPLIRGSVIGPAEQRKPVVLVGNKIDLIDYSTITNVLGVMDDYPEVESCIECSAKTLYNISEMFYYAQKAVLHPTTPLYSIVEQNLTDHYKKALIRIFKICDMDSDGLLNDHELNHFQQKCFNGPLQMEILEEIKYVLSRNVQDAIINESVTLQGFLFMHCLFIQRGRSEINWAVLRRFGYNESLEMSFDYMQPLIEIPPDSSTELSDCGQQFLTKLFERYDRDGDGALSPNELKALFSVCPEVPWPSFSDLRRTVPTNENGWLTLHGWMCRWTLQTLIDLPKTFEHLAYLGFNVHENESQLAAIQVTRERKLDLAKKESNRSVYMCHVIGPKNAGKTALCRALIAEDTQKLLNRNFFSGSHHCVNSVRVYGQEKYLIMRDIDVNHELDQRNVNCDVVCLIYDTNNPKSFEHIARTFIKYYAQSKIPILIAGTKTDLPAVRQEYSLQPQEFCRKYKIIPPEPFSLKQNKKELFVKLTTMAAFPRFQDAWILFYKHRFDHLWDGKSKYSGSDPLMWWKSGIGLAAATFIGYFAVKNLHK